MKEEVIKTLLAVGSAVTAFTVTLMWKKYDSGTKILCNSCMVAMPTMIQRSNCRLLFLLHVFRHTHRIRHPIMIFTLYQLYKQCSATRFNSKRVKSQNCHSLKWSKYQCKRNPKPPRTIFHKKVIKSNEGPAVLTGTVKNTQYITILHALQVVQCTHESADALW
jgi:hypothetical protein